MAYSTLLSLEKAISEILDCDRFSVSLHEKKQLISLDKYVVCFQAFLEDFTDKAKFMETRMRCVAAEAEDIIERFLSEQICHIYGYTKRISIVRRMMFVYQLHKVRDKMDSIAAELVEIKNSIVIKDIQLGDSGGPSSSSQVADIGKINMVGFNKDLIEITEKLCGRGPQLQVLPIFGMGGIGKTTLASNAYNDQFIVDYFHVRVWITISQHYSERRILLDLVDSMKEFDQDTEYGNESSADIHELRVKVHKILSGRRFLIVMDDIWNKKVLDDVKHLFPDYNNGSRIMLTTRLAEVANYANSSILPHEMCLMDADQSWNLLRQKLLINQYSIPLELEIIGREIAISCRGLPLSTVVVAGLLSTKSKTVNSWREVARNIRSSLSTNDGQIQKILSLSYNNLPHHLRSCFLYMGGFPEDHEIKVTELIRLWIAEGFVKPVVSKEMEDTAEEYLEDLVNRSLIVVTERKSDGKIKSCSLHDMVRDMCIKLSHEEKFLVHVSGIGALELLKSMKDQRRISISHSNLNSMSDIYSPTVRTIIYFQDKLNSFGSFRSLRVLNMPRVINRLFTDQFFELLHLRYLALCFSNPITRSISNLQSLQTLIIRNTADKCLPYEIWNMQQLRHLIVSTIRLPDTNAASSALENLQTLGKVENLTCSVSTLNLIPNLRKVWLTYSSGSGELLVHNLVLLNRLEKLHLELGYGWIESSKPNLVAPSSLRKLTLVGWGRREPYLNIVGPFPNLEVLKLRSFNFMARVWRTADEDFPRLKFLLIDYSDLTYWETETSHFPRLKALHIRSCLNLSKIPDCIGEIPTLELISLKFCTESLADSAKQIQEEAQSYADDVFQVRCIDFVASGEPSTSPTTSPTRSPLQSTLRRVVWMVVSESRCRRFRHLRH